MGGIEAGCGLGGVITDVLDVAYEVALLVVALRLAPVRSNGPVRRHGLLPAVIPHRQAPAANHVSAANSALGLYNQRTPRHAEQEPERVDLLPA